VKTLYPTRNETGAPYAEGVSTGLCVEDNRFITIKKRTTPPAATTVPRMTKTKPVTTKKPVFRKYFNQSRPGGQQRNHRTQIRKQGSLICQNGTVVRQVIPQDHFVRIKLCIQFNFLSTDC